MISKESHDMSTFSEIAPDEYWSRYDWARPFAEEEARLNPDLLDPQHEYRQYLPAEPSHPRAWIPPYVRWAKRKQVDFTCPITGWKETDWFRGNGGGPFRRIGTLTMDHIIPGALGGLTTDENIRAISYLANSIKGHKQVSDEDLRKRVLGSYKIVSMPEDLLMVLDKYGITSYKVGP
jgi:hypothetical protein